MSKTRSLFVAIVGRPNVGKSTLINQLIGKKIAITSEKPQTTRHNILGIVTNDDDQIVFIDTPGLHKAKDLLNRVIDKKAVDSIFDSDIAMFIVDKKKGPAEEHIINYFKSAKKKVILVINKIDLLDNKSEIDEIILSYLNEYEFADVIPISARDNTNIDKLLLAIKSHLIEGPHYFDSLTTTDQTEEQMIQELIREKIIYHTNQEVPHAVAVVVENMTYNKSHKTLDVRALIVVERPTQKVILLGAGGEKIKTIGTLARKDINKTLDVKVHLELWIKVKKDWRNRQTDLKALGYDSN